MVAATHIIFLVHGLELLPYAGPSSLSFLAQRLEDTLAEDFVVHNIQCNKHSLWRAKTHDGVENGGQRAADEIRAVVESRKDTLRRISIIGFSLGGLYSRYVVASLYDEKTKLVCGLEPTHFITLASPHLGVRSFFPMQRLLEIGARVIFGRTAPAARCSCVMRKDCLKK